MLEDLTRPKRLLAYTGENGARLYSYLHVIVHSLPFYERWKDWRFGRRVRVPAFIQDIAPIAGRLFLWMCDGRSLEWMAQEAQESVEKIESIASRIIDELTVREKLNLLDRLEVISLTGLGQEKEEGNVDVEAEVPDYSWDPVEERMRGLIAKGWKELTPVEQFVLEAMVIEERKASDVLEALIRVGVCIKEGAPPEKIDRQQLYYFKRTALGKLARLSGRLRMNKGKR